MQQDHARLRQALGEAGSDLLDRWGEAARARCWQLRTTPEHEVQLRERAQTFVDCLAIALRDAKDLALGGQEMREPIQHFSFLAGWMAGVRLPISATVALCHGLQDVLGPDPRDFFQSLVVVGTEAYAAGLDQAAHARHRQIIEKSQVVCLLPGSVAALFLVGDPDREALDDAVGRLMMLAVMKQAKHLLLDTSGLLEPDKVMSSTVRFVAEHREALADRRVVVTGVPDDRVAALAGESKLHLEGYEQLEQGLASLFEGAAD